MIHKNTRRNPGDPPGSVSLFSQFPGISGMAAWSNRRGKTAGNLTNPENGGKTPVNLRDGSAPERKGGFAP
jgi:hypothetical protein